MNRKWFTLIEVVLSITLIILLTVSVYSSIVDLQNKSQLNELKSKSLAYLTVINNQLSNIIKNSYWIDYANTITTNDLWVISLWQDKNETKRIKIFVDKDVDKDISRVVVSYNGQLPVAMHSNLAYIEKFKINISADPRNFNQAVDEQPWVSFDIWARTRSPLEQATQDNLLNMYEKSSMHIYWRWMIKNYFNSSLKN